MISTSTIAGHVAKHVAALGQQAGGHQLERRVLGPAGPDRARERAVRADHEPVHGSSIARLPGASIGGLVVAATRPGRPPDRNLAMELVRVTEAAAMAASRWMGRGDKEGADGAAVDAMRVVLPTVAMDGVVVIGEGEKDNAPMLYNGERIGDGTPPKTDIAVDPIDGTTLTSLGRGGALAVIAVSERGTMFDPGPVRLHGEAGRRPAGRGRRRHHAQRPTENLQRARQGPGQARCAT